MTNIIKFHLRKETQSAHFSDAFKIASNRSLKNFDHELEDKHMRAVAVREKALKPSLIAAFFLLFLILLVLLNVTILPIFIEIHFTERSAILSLVAVLIFYCCIFLSIVLMIFKTKKLSNQILITI